MITEVPEVRQIPGEGLRRWFSGDGFDLIVWIHKDTITGLQLCYERGRQPGALTWTETRGYQHHAIDEGDHPGHKMKGTPILTGAPARDMKGVIQRFIQAADELPADIRQFVTDKLSALKP